MSNEYDYYDGMPPHQRRDTSHMAAARIETSATNLRGKVYRHIRSRKHWGATDIEIQHALAMNPSTQRPRRIELTQKGLVRDSGHRRRTPSGRYAAVWVAVEHE